MAAQPLFSSSSGPPPWLGYLLLVLWIITASYLAMSNQFHLQSEESVVVSDSLSLAHATSSTSSGSSGSVVPSNREIPCNFWERNTPQDVEALNWRVKFCDEFHDESMWNVEGDENFRGFSGIHNGSYIWSGQGKTWLLLRPVGLGSMRDFYAFLRARIVSGTEDTCFGLWFRENRDGVYHYYICYEGHFGIWYLYQNRWHPMKYLYSKNPTAVFYREKEWNSLGVWVQDSRFEFYLNDNLIDATINKKLSRGLIALTLESRGGNFQIELDRFFVLAP